MKGRKRWDCNLEQLYLNDDPECCVSLSSSEGRGSREPIAVAPSTAWASVHLPPVVTSSERMHNGYAPP
ncbi:hypothetical protein N1851_023791 [Merluccius polli]|uniref:Uncharacterized protein n=1 Tax=Merluccius polli TaxID=89951 RepID=A0AA47MFT7_MERPO|nr:hypothetical protein N1851_023791 [Merluccius polli]